MCVKSVLHVMWGIGLGWVGLAGGGGVAWGVGSSLKGVFATWEPWEYDNQILVISRQISATIDHSNTSW